MSDIPIQALSIQKRSLLDKSLAIPRFYSTLIDYSINSRFISYVIELGVELEYNIIHVSKIHTRYSVIRRLYDNVSSDMIHLPTFPSKQWFYNLSKDTAEYRMKTMEPFISSLNMYKTLTADKIINSLSNGY